MKCKNNPFVDCTVNNCEDCKYEKGIKEAAMNPNTEITGFSFIADDGTPVEGLHFVPTGGDH